MNILFNKLTELRGSSIGELVNTRLGEFKKLGNDSNDELFSELCFCLLTANSKASTALKIQEDLGVNGFLNANVNEVSNCIKSNKHRFHNNKADYIIGARKYSNIKEIISKFDDAKDLRVWFVKDVKGLGYKEASHFLRNIGFTDVAIVDRHILRVLQEHGFIEKIPSSITKKEYLRIEGVLEQIAKRNNMSLAELDLYLWYMKTGKVLK